MWNDQGRRRSVVLYWRLLILELLGLPLVAVMAMWMILKGMTPSSIYSPGQPYTTWFDVPIVCAEEDAGVAASIYGFLIAAQTDQPCRQWMSSRPCPPSAWWTRTSVRLVDAYSSLNMPRQQNASFPVQGGRRTL